MTAAEQFWPHVAFTRLDFIEPAKTACGVDQVQLEAEGGETVVPGHADGLDGVRLERVVGIEKGDDVAGGARQTRR